MTHTDNTAAITAALPPIGGNMYFTDPTELGAFLHSGSPTAIETNRVHRVQDWPYELGAPNSGKHSTCPWCGATGPHQVFAAVDYPKTMPKRKPALGLPSAWAVCMDCGDHEVDREELTELVIPLPPPDWRNGLQMQPHGTVLERDLYTASQPGETRAFYDKAYIDLLKAQYQREQGNDLLADIMDSDTRSKAVVFAEAFEAWKASKGGQEPKIYRERPRVGHGMIARIAAQQARTAGLRKMMDSRERSRWDSAYRYYKGTFRTEQDRTAWERRFGSPGTRPELQPVKSITPKEWTPTLPPVEELMERAIAEKDWTYLEHDCANEKARAVVVELVLSERKRRKDDDDELNHSRDTLNARIAKKKAAAAALDPKLVEIARATKKAASKLARVFKKGPDGSDKGPDKGPMAKLEWANVDLNGKPIKKCGFSQGLLNARTRQMQGVGRPCGKLHCPRCGPWLRALQTMAIINMPLTSGNEIIAMNMGDREVWFHLVPKPRIESWKRKFRISAIRGVRGYSGNTEDSKKQAPFLDAYVAFDKDPDSESGFVSVLATCPVNVRPYKGSVGVQGVPVEDVQKTVIDLSLATISVHNAQPVGSISSSDSLHLDPEGICDIAAASEWVMEIEKLESLKVFENALVDAGIPYTRTPYRVITRGLVHRKVRAPVWGESERYEGNTVNLSEMFEDPALDMLDELLDDNQLLDNSEKDTP